MLVNSNVDHFKKIAGNLVVVQSELAIRINSIGKL
jgi:hypothetical protein